MAPGIVVADTSVLVNFLRIDPMDLIGDHPDMFIATDHIAAEIVDSYPDQQARYRVARDAGHLDTSIYRVFPEEVEVARSPEGDEGDHWWHRSRWAVAGAPGGRGRSGE